MIKPKPKGPGLVLLGLVTVSMWAFVCLAEAEESGTKPVEFLPEQLSYRPYVADPRRPRFSAKWLFNDKGDSQIDTAIGGYLPLLDFRRPSARGEEWQVAGFAGVWARFDTHENLDEIGEDFRVGLSLSYRMDRWAVRLQGFHESDHLGDEFVIRTGRRRISYRREDIGLGLSYGPQPNYRLYAEAGYGYALGKLNEPWRLQAGAEWEGSPVLPLGGQLFAAADLQTWEEVEWDPDLNMQAGVVVWNERRNRALRLGIEFYTGRDPLGEFFRENLSYWTLGFSLDY